MPILLPVLDPEICDCLRAVIDPEIGINIVDLGLVLSAEHAPQGIEVKLTLTSRACPLGDMVLFSSFFGAAVAYRSRPEVHKRLVLLACVAIMFAGAFRLDYALNLPAQLAVWYLPVVAGMAYDLHKSRRVHPVYWIGAAVMGIGLLRIPFGATEVWHRIAGPLLMRLV